MTDQHPSTQADADCGDEYIRITPSRSDLAPETVVRQLTGLHGLDAGGGGLLSEISPFGDPPPVFEFLAVSEGADEPVEFYYGADRRMDALEERLRTLYPPTVTFERVKLDVEQKLIPSSSESVSETNAVSDQPPRGDPASPAEPRDDSTSESEGVALFDPADQEPVGDGGSVLSRDSTSQDNDEGLFGAESSNDPPEKEHPDRDGTPAERSGPLTRLRAPKIRPRSESSGTGRLTVARIG
jgi:hypothetical protein